MRGLVKREARPGLDVTDDAALLEFCRNNGATLFHPSGTCAMGPAPKLTCTEASPRARASCFTARVKAWIPGSMDAAAMDDSRSRK